MHISVSQAKAQLTDLVRRVEAGDEVVLTRHGRPAVRLVAIQSKPDADAKWAIMEAVRGTAVSDGTSAARSQDFLYDDDGLPA